MHQAITPHQSFTVYPLYSLLFIFHTHSFCLYNLMNSIQNCLSAKEEFILSRWCQGWNCQLASRSPHTRCHLVWSHRVGPFENQTPPGHHPTNRQSVSQSHRPKSVHTWSNLVGSDQICAAASRPDGTVHGDLNWLRYCPGNKINNNPSSVRQSANSHLHH